MPDTRLNVGAPPGMHFAQEPRIATSGISVYVVWWDTRDSLGDIYLNRSLDAGATWLSPDVRLDVGTAPGAASSHSPEIAASGGSVYAVWVDERNGGQDVYFNRSMDRGSTWLPADVRLDVGTAAGEASSRQPCIANRGLSVFVGWTDDRNQMVT